MYLLYHAYMYLEFLILACTIYILAPNPNNPLSDNSREKQVELLNRCLNDYPKGIIIGKDTTIGRYVIGEHELSMEKVTYHIGFSRKPGWLEEDSGSIN